MKFKELLTVIDNNRYLNIVSEKGYGCLKVKLLRLHWIYLKEKLNYWMLSVHL